MAKPWSAIKHKSGDTPEHAERVAEHRKRIEREVDAYTLTLAALRRARDVSQVELAAELGVSQPQVSRLEQAGDALLSTLARHVEALGGELALVATFPDGVEARIEMREVVEEKEPVSA